MISYKPNQGNRIRTVYYSRSKTLPNCERALLDERCLSEHCWNCLSDRVSDATVEYSNQALLCCLKANLSSNAPALVPPARSN